MHVSHSIFSEVPLGSKKHTEDTEINLFDAERERAFKTLPTPFFFCSSYEADAGWGKLLSKQLPSWNAPEQKLSPWSPDNPGTLKHPCKEKREGKSGETQTLKMEGFPHIGLLVMGSPRISGRDGTPWWGRTQQTGFPHRLPCLDAWQATRKKKVSKKHEIRVNKAVKT